MNSIYSLYIRERERENVKEKEGEAEGEGMRQVPREMGINRHSDARSEQMMKDERRQPWHLCV